MLDWLELPGEESDEGELTEDVRRTEPAEELMAAAEALFHEGAFAQAAGEFAKAREHDPMLFAAWAAECEAHVRAGDLAAADACATEALETYGRVPLFYAAKAIVLAHQGYLREAYQHSDIAVREHGSSAFTWLSRAEVILSSARVEALGSCEGCFEKAFALDPSGWHATLRAGLMLRDWGHAERALGAFSQVARLAPNNAFLWKCMGDCRRQMGQEATARECYLTALAKSPDHEPTLAALRSMGFWGRFRARLARLLRRG